MAVPENNLPLVGVTGRSPLRITLVPKLLLGNAPGQEAQLPTHLRCEARASQGVKGFPDTGFRRYDDSA